MKTNFESEVAGSERFRFGENWRRFLQVVNEERIREAERSLQSMLETEDLRGRSFLDIGSGSGLFSLAAARLGADRIHSFDYDPQSVACTRELMRRYLPDATRWAIEPGSALDDEYLRRLGQWDIVYSWGVLHHTGDMWRAIDNVLQTVKRGGRLFISIYNDQGGASRRWRTVKKLYNRNPVWRALICAVFIPYFVLGAFALDIVHAKNPFARYMGSQKGKRGMSVMYDWLDWLGGYPFEVARPGEIFDFCRARGFTLLRLKTEGGNLGCNEFVFRKD